MNYQETIQYLYNSTPVFEHVGASAYKEGLDNSLALDEHLAMPHRQFKTIHVAGTNGKGSTAHTLAAILQACGYRVGLYTSPHLIDFRERIRVNGEPLSEAYVVNFVARHRDFFEPLHPSFFELTTAMAFSYFAESSVDVAVIEVGLGGRLDCTNIISPVLSVITNISLDHTGFLGNTLAQIASEKAGIIKKETPVVVGETTAETHPVFANKAKEMHAPMVWAEVKPEVLQWQHRNEGGLNLQTRSFGNVVFELGGNYQHHNANTILTATLQLQTLGFAITATAVAQGMANVCQSTGLQGRWQTLSTTPRVICDTGHNVAGWQYLSTQLAAQSYRTLRMVFGMVDDKDLDTVLTLLPKDATYYFTQASTHRAVPSEIVAQKAEQNALHGHIYNKVRTAYDAALNDAEEGDLVFVGGSSYVVADLLSSLETPPITTNRP